MAGGLCLKLVGVLHMGYGDWALVTSLVVVVQSALWWMVHEGWDERIGWDPHFIVLPMLAAALLFDSYVYLTPDSRFRILMVWFVALLFGAGHMGFREVVLVSTAMAAGWLGAVRPHARPGATIVMAYEVSVALTFWMITVAAGIVFERLKRERLERTALRRRLAEQALTDPLTGLPNRRQFEEALRMELARFDRHGGGCGVVMVDVDFFKNYNDRNGHMAGDDALRELATLLRRHLRTEDQAARVGGEEFAFIMPDTTKDEAFRVLERLRVIVESHPFFGSEGQPGGRLTISVGIACCPEDACDYEGLLRRADAALYSAKNSGRNQVTATA
jgi:diguanylate cyclase (GGDEF)-like protein